MTGAQNRRSETSVGPDSFERLRGVWHVGSGLLALAPLVSDMPKWDAAYFSSIRPEFAILVAFTLFLLFIMLPIIAYGARLALGDTRFSADQDGIHYYYFGRAELRSWPEIVEIKRRGTGKLGARIVFANRDEQKRDWVLSFWRRACIEPYSVPLTKMLSHEMLFEQVKALHTAAELRGRPATKNLPVTKPRTEMPKIRRTPTVQR